MYADDFTLIADAPARITIYECFLDSRIFLRRESARKLAVEIIKPSMHWWMMPSILFFPSKSDGNKSKDLEWLRFLWTHSSIT